MAKAVVSLSRLKEVLEYDQETGLFTQKVRRKGGLRVGEVAGCLSHGYILISIDYRKYRAHRLAWLWMTGEMLSDVDHKNTNRSDNRWCNLRLANRSQNMANSPLCKANTSGFKGVSRFRNKWQAYISKDYVRYPLGLFDTPEEAHEAYKRAAREMHGEFARFS